MRTRMKRTYPQRHAMFQHLNFKKCSEDDSFSTFSLPNVLFATAACNFSTLARTKVVQTRHVLYILTSELLHFKKCSEDDSFSTFSLPNTAACNFSTLARTKVVQTRHVLYILTSELLHFKKCSEDDSFSTFSLPHVLFATAACNFSTSALTKVLSECGVFDIFTSECAFRHSRVHFFIIRTYKNGPNTSCFVHFTSKCAFRYSGVQFLMYPLSSDLRTRRFNRPTFRLTRPTNH